MDELNQLRDALDMPQVQHDTTDYQLPLVAPTPMSPLPSDPRVEQPTVLHMTADRVHAFLKNRGEIQGQIDRGEISKEKGFGLMLDESMRFKPTPAEIIELGKRVTPKPEKATPTPINGRAGFILTPEDFGYNVVKPEKPTPEVQALHEIFGIAEPQPTQAPQQQAQAVQAAEQTRHIVNSNVTTIATLPIQRDENGSRFWNSVETANKSIEKPALVDPYLEYEENKQKELAQYKEATQKTVDALSNQHPDEAVMKAIGTTVDPYAFTKAQPSLGKLPRLTPNLEGLDAHNRLRHLLGVK
jgi:hypothetical protein